MGCVSSRVARPYIHPSPLTSEIFWCTQRGTTLTRIDLFVAIDWYTHRNFFSRIPFRQKPQNTLEKLAITLQYYQHVYLWTYIIYVRWKYFSEWRAIGSTISFPWSCNLPFFDNCLVCSIHEFATNHLLACCSEVLTAYQLGAFIMVMKVITIPNVCYCTDSNIFLLKHARHNIRTWFLFRLTGVSISLLTISKQKLKQIQESLLLLFPTTWSTSCLNSWTKSFALVSILKYTPYFP